jgi:hypothetical protein
VLVAKKPKTTFEPVHVLDDLAAGPVVDEAHPPEDRELLDRAKQRLAVQLPIDAEELASRVGHVRVPCRRQREGVWFHRPALGFAYRAAF